ncbi:caveolin-3-like [Octopus vulgaris]|uniref:Caveolin n=1 Tax=Octopus vulgaris TaxID=6645 RepID=A0AA36AZZ7_OCTVU|nr:caveolin-3-like [Octopus vulgaris]
MCWSVGGGFDVNSGGSSSGDGGGRGYGGGENGSMAITIVEGVVTFQEIIAEPEPSVFSLDKVWILSFKVFNVTKIWCYRITSTALALPMAVLCGINFACMSFCNVWVVNPLLSYQIISCDINIH